MGKVGYARGEISFEVAVVMIAVDCILYWLIGYAVSAVIKSE